MLERLQKIIARAGIASRRHAEELIVSGQVKVNGVVVTELGAKADPEHDKVEAAGRLAEQPEAVSHYILNKPPNVVSTMADPEGRATLRHLLRGLSGGVFPVGRLDYAASGLILLTTDGQLADSIFKVSSTLVKVYWLKVQGRPTRETLAKVTHKAQARVRLLPTPDAAMGAGHPINPWYEAELRGPRRDLLRQAFFAAGHPVEKTKRVRFGPLELGDLPEGQYRQLAPSEVALLRRAVEKAAAQVVAAISPPAAAPVGVRPFERKKWRQSSERGAGAGRPVQQRGGATGERGPVDRPSGRPPEQKKKWQPNFSRGPARPVQPGGAGDAERPGRSQFAPGGKGAPSRGGAGVGRPFPPRGGRPFRPRDERSGQSGRGRGAGPSGGSEGQRSGGPRFGGDRFAAGGKGAPNRGGAEGGRPFPPRGGRPFRPRDDRGAGPGGATGPRGGGQRFGADRFAAGGKGAPGRSGTGGARPFPPRGERSGAGGGRGAGQPGGSGDQRGGYRGKGSGKFLPGAPRQGGPASGKFRGKRPPGRPPGKPGGRPPNRRGGPSNVPPRRPR